jgi:WXG100 family type VII secretion target
MTDGSITAAQSEAQNRAAELLHGQYNTFSGTYDELSAQVEQFSKGWQGPSGEAYIGVMRSWLEHFEQINEDLSSLASTMLGNADVTARTTRVADNVVESARQTIAAATNGRTGLKGL